MSIQEERRAERAETAALEEMCQNERAQVVTILRNLTLAQSRLHEILIYTRPAESPECAEYHLAAKSLVTEALQQLLVLKLYKM